MIASKLPDKVLCKGLRRSFSYATRFRYGDARSVPEIYSLVAFGKCNLACRFCFSCGADADADGVLPDAKEIHLYGIESFIREEVAAGRGIRISGGEPTLFTDVTIHLLQLIRSLGGFSIVDTNATQPNEVDRVASFTDVLSIDALRAPRDLVENLTQRDSVLCWDAPLECVRRLGSYTCVVEFKTVLFDFSDLAFLEEVHGLLQPNVYWTLKCYQPTKSRFPLSLDEEIERLAQPIELRPPAKEEAERLARALLHRHPELRGRLQLILGSARSVESYRSFV